MTVLTAQTATTSTRSERPKGMTQRPQEMKGCLARSDEGDRQTLSARAHGKAPCALTLYRVPSPYQDCEVQVNLFQTVKAAVTVKQAAALYGLPVTPNGMVCCPFHEDHTPSMKLNDACYYCFGCGATGDVIDLTARIFDLSSLQAARKLVQDFDLSPDKPPSGAVALPSHLSPPRTPSKRILPTVSGSSMTTMAL